MGKKNKGVSKPVDVRKAFKKSKDYKKSNTVGTTEEAGSKYRKKLRQRQQESVLGMK